MSLEPIEEFRLALDAAIAGFGLNPLLEVQASQMGEHYELLLKWNKRVNLTRIVEPGEAAVRHYAESLFGARFIAPASKVLDIGSGAGFPGLPIAVIRRDLEVTALESNQRKSLFLTEAREVLRLTNFKVAAARLEEFDWTEFGFLTSRALDRAEETFRILIERLSERQNLILYCSSDLAEKLKNQATPNLNFESHPIPQSEGRIIVVVSRT